VVDMAHIAGLIAGGVHPSPVPYADIVTSTTHKTLRGPRGGIALAREEHAKALDKAVFPGMQGGPLMHVIAAKAVALKEASTDEFRDYARRVVANAAALAETLMERGVRLVSGGTDNHLLLLDLSDGELTGKAAEAALEAAGITTNKNTVPGEKRSPFVTSGDPDRHGRPDDPGDGRGGHAPGRRLDRRCPGVAGRRFRPVPGTGGDPRARRCVPAVRGVAAGPRGSRPIGRCRRTPRSRIASPGGFRQISVGIRLARR
jgi:hypothetical protein